MLEAEAGFCVVKVPKHKGVNKTRMETEVQLDPAHIQPPATHGPPAVVPAAAGPLPKKSKKASRHAAAATAAAAAAPVRVKQEPRERSATPAPAQAPASAPAANALQAAAAAGGPQNASANPALVPNAAYNAAAAGTGHQQAAAPVLPRTFGLHMQQQADGSYTALLSHPHSSAAAAAAGGSSSPWVWDPTPEATQGPGWGMVPAATGAGQAGRVSTSGSDGTEGSAGGDPELASLLQLIGGCDR